ncbi:sensor histidine kinase [Lentimicrobium saccharophilum]|nr:HAMP domain-containing sensor histidine kinase [Lentimicrobium saccharophilum]
MKHYISNSKADFRFNREESAAGREEALKVNLGRLVYLISIGLSVAIAHIVLFYFFNTEASGTELQWKNGIIASHSTMFLVFLITGFSVIIIRKRGLFNKPCARAIPHFMFLFFLMLGTIITGIDQLITNAITPFMIVCFFTAMVLIIPPLLSALYYLFAYTLFFFVITHFQPFQDVLLSNYVNGLTSVAIAWFLSMVLWRNFVYRFRNDRLVRQQQTALQEQNLELSRIANELREVNKSRIRLFSIISHDLRGPLANLSSLMRLVQSDDITEPEFKELLPELASQTLLTSELLDNLLNWSKNNLNGITCHPKAFAIHEITSGIIRLYAGQADLKGLEILNKTDPQHKAYADPGMISLVLRNLISNAIKFSGKNGKITVYSKLSGEVTEISVEDTGIGIKPERIPSLFGDDQFSTQGTAGEKGTGLGLMLCKEFVERNGGRIGVQSTPEKGSRFWFTVPTAT